MALTGPSCDHDSVPENRKIAFGYDARDRLKQTTYGDGSPGVSRTYTADGLPETIVAPLVTWTYQYNKRRLLVKEHYWLPWQTFDGAWHFDYGIDAHGSSAHCAIPGAAPTCNTHPTPWASPRRSRAMPATSATTPTARWPATR